MSSDLWAVWVTDGTGPAHIALPAGRALCGQHLTNWTLASDAQKRCGKCEEVARAG